MIEVFNLLFGQEFLLRALVVGLMLSLCCALLGVSLVLKRFSMIGDGLSHVSFGAMAIACAANVAPIYFALPIVLVSAFLLLRMNERGKIKGDAAIALISTGALAVGVMVTSMTTGMNVDIYNYMFGSILTMSDSDVVITAVISLVIITLFILFYAEIFAVTFDESFAQATGTKTSVYNMLIAGLTAVTIVIGMKMMGALLISSLIIFPTVISMRVCKSFKGVVIFGSLISLFSFVSGLVLSVVLEAPTGASIVCVNLIVLLFFTLLGKINSSNKTVIFKRATAAILTAVLIIAPVLTLFFVKPDIYKKTELSIVTTGFAQYDFARQIVGDRGDVTLLLSPGEESHTYEPTANDIILIERCDVFICGGGESETWVEKIISSGNSDFTVIKMMDVVNLCETDHDHEHTDDEHNHGEEYDEHVWTSPVNALKIVDAVLQAVCDSDIKNADYYTEQADKYKNELEGLDAKFRTLTDISTGKYIVIGDRFPLQYLMSEYEIDYYAAFPGCSAQVEVNPVTIANINEMVKRDNISTVFKVDMSKGEVAYSISEATGASVDTLYSCHTVSADGLSAGETYISLMNKNYEALKKALK